MTGKHKINCDASTYSAIPPSIFKSVPESIIEPFSDNCGRLIIFIN